VSAALMFAALMFAALMFAALCRLLAQPQVEAI
jgi:hypothetical protein